MAMAVSLWTINGEEDIEISVHPSGQRLQMFWGPPLLFSSPEHGMRRTAGAA